MNINILPLNQRIYKTPLHKNIPNNKMDNSFFAYLQHLEMMAFFSGYPLIYAVVLFVSGNKQSVNNFRNRGASLLQYAYALVGTLFVGFQLKKLLIGYNDGSINISFQQPLLIIWGLLAILFWIPALAKKAALSLAHSSIFFFLLLWDIFMQKTLPNDNGNLLANDMKIYTGSLLLNATSLGFMVLIVYIFNRYSQRKSPIGS